MRNVFLLVLLIGLQNVTPLIAQSDTAIATNPETATKAGGKLTDKVERLINQLESKNPKPSKETRTRSPFEKEVWNAVDSLYEQGISAFPRLVSHFDDDRFSFSQDYLSSGPEDNPVRHDTVGFLCREIVRSQVEKNVLWAGDPRGTPGYSRGIVPRNKEDVVAWWDKNTGRHLWELQIENVRFVIVENQERLKTEHDLNDRGLCEAAIRANEKLILQLSTTKSPLKTKPYRPYFGK